MGQPRPLFHLFSVFSYKLYNFLQQRRDSNPRPFEHESSPITTRSGLPPKVNYSIYGYSGPFNKTWLSYRTLTSAFLSPVWPPMPRAWAAGWGRSVWPLGTGTTRHSGCPKWFPTWAATCSSELKATTGDLTALDSLLLASMTRDLIFIRFVQDYVNSK